MDRKSSRMDTEYQFPFLIPKGKKQHRNSSSSSSGEGAEEAKRQRGKERLQGVWGEGDGDRVWPLIRKRREKWRERLLPLCHISSFTLVWFEFCFLCATNTGHRSGLCLACPEFRQSCFTNTAYSQTECSSDFDIRSKGKSYAKRETDTHCYCCCYW